MSRFTRASAVLAGPCVLAALACAQVFDHVRGMEQEPSRNPQDADSLAAQPESGGGEVSYLDGRLLRMPPADADWRNADLHSRVNGGDRVRTVERSRAEIDLGDDNLIRLAPLTTLDLRKLQEEQADLHADRADTQTGHTSDIFIEEGEIWAELNGLEEADQFEISSGLVGAAITGTGLRIRQDQRTGALVRVYHGEVQLAASPEALKTGQPVRAEELGSRLQSPANAQAPHTVAGPVPVAGPHQVSLEDWLVIVGAMQQVVLDAQGRVTAAGAFSAADNQEQDPWIQWNQARNSARSKTPATPAGDGHQGGKP